jgi:2-iminobutanoate/2-iminopropanoate deaminase
LSSANVRGGDFTSIELAECNLDSAMLELSTLDNATIKNCNFIGAYLNATNFIGARVSGGDWSKVDLHRSDWSGAVVESVCFNIGRFQGARLHKSTFTNCSLQTANARCHNRIQHCI